MSTAIDLLRAEHALEMSQLVREQDIATKLISFSNAHGLKPSSVYQSKPLYGCASTINFKYNQCNIKDLLDAFQPIMRSKFNSTFAYDVPLKYRAELMRVAGIHKDVLDNKGNAWEYQGPKLSVSNYNRITWYCEIDAETIKIDYDMCGDKRGIMPFLQVCERKIMGGTEVTSWGVSGGPCIKGGRGYRSGGSREYAGTYYFCFDDVESFLSFADKAGM